MSASVEAQVKAVLESLETKIKILLNPTQVQSNLVLESIPQIGYNYNSILNSLYVGKDALNKLHDQVQVDHRELLDAALLQMTDAIRKYEGARAKWFSELEAIVRTSKAS